MDTANSLNCFYVALMVLHMSPQIWAILNWYQMMSWDHTILVMLIGRQTHHPLATLQQQPPSDLQVVRLVRARAAPQEGWRQDCSRTSRAPCPSPSHHPACNEPPPQARPCPCNPQPSTVTVACRAVHHCRLHCRRAQMLIVNTKTSEH